MAAKKVTKIAFNKQQKLHNCQRSVFVVEFLSLIHPYFAHKYAIFNSLKFRVLINNKFYSIINLEYSCIRV